MQSLLRASPRTLRGRLPGFAPVSQASTRPYAQSSYGDSQGGERGSDEPNPMSHLEHPGPEAPASKSSGSSSKTQSSSEQGSSSGGKGRPAIHHPESAAEKDDPEVRKHNEEMRQRADSSVNQLAEDDNKVNPQFWKGDVGDHKQQKDS